MRLFTTQETGSTKNIPTGLTEKEVLDSRNQYGENRLTKKKHAGFWRSFAESFGDPMIKILLAALGINIIFLAKNANWFESIGIAFAILIATLVSTISEYGSESAFEKLQEEAAKIRCRVKRADGITELPIEEIVVGDVVMLQPGERIPADGLLINGQLEVDQSALNGESKEAKKRPSINWESRTHNDDFLVPDLLFSGTIVCSGNGMMLVTSIGDRTFYGRIGEEIQEETRESPLKLRLRGLAASIGKFGYIAAAFSALAFLFNNIFIDNAFHPELIRATAGSWRALLPLLLQAGTLAVTVVVMAVPEGLPMMITVVLSANMKRMLKDNVLVRKLIGIETAGSINILFTDKTGTLTSGKLEVVEFTDGTGKIWSRQEMTNNTPALGSILKDCLHYNTAAVMEGERAIGGNATDRAVLEFSQQLGGGNDNLQCRVMLPFTSENKIMISTVSGSWNTSLIKGAPEKILSHCTHYYDQTGTVHPFHMRSKIQQLIKLSTEKSMRVIAIATADTGVRCLQDLKNLKLVGLVAIKDSIRPSTYTGILQVQEAGVQTVMITGDAKNTAAAIAKEVGIIRNSTDLVISHDEIEKMSDEALTTILPQIRVVARALPSDKSRLVRIAQAKDMVVGMTGDGVNDAPALKQADIGFAMGSGTEVAKEAGDIVILNNEYDSIANAICYGRTIFNTIRKFIIYQMTTCLCAVGITVIGPLLNVDFPITVIQMLWINIVMDTLAGLAFSGEKARPDYMKEAPKRRDEPIINPYMKSQIATGSIYAVVLCLCFLKSHYFLQMMAENRLYALTVFFGLFMFCTIFNSFNARTHKINLLNDISANVSFLVLMGFITVIQIIILYFGGQVFRTVPLKPQDLLFITALAFTVIPVDIFRKLFVKDLRISDTAGSTKKECPKINTVNALKSE